MQLEDLADRALSLIQRQPSMKLSTAVSQVAEGQGLNSEGLHRLGTMVNRKYLVSDQTSKQSSGTPLWTSRWETAKAGTYTKTSSDDAYNARSTTPKDEDPKSRDMGSMGSAGKSTDDALSYQLHSLRTSVTNMSALHDPDENPDTQPSSFEQAQKDMDKASEGGLHYQDTWTSSDEDRFAKLSMFMLPPERREALAGLKKVSNVRAMVHQHVHLLEDEYRKSIETVDQLALLRDKLSSNHTIVQTVLNSAVQESVQAGLTVGEALQFVKLAGRSERVMGEMHDDPRIEGWFLDYSREALPALGVDIEAALGNSYDARGYKKTSHIARNQERVLVRPEVLSAPEDPRSIQDPGAPLVKAAAAYYASRENMQVADVAHQAAVQAVKEMDRGLREAYEIREQVINLPDHLIAERL